MVGATRIRFGMFLCRGAGLGDQEEGFFLFGDVGGLSILLLWVG